MHQFKVGQVWETRHQRPVRVEALYGDGVRVQDAITGHVYTTNLFGFRKEGRSSYGDLVRLVGSAQPVMKD